MIKFNFQVTEKDFFRAENSLRLEVTPNGFTLFGDDDMWIIDASLVKENGRIILNPKSDGYVLYPIPRENDNYKEYEIVKRGELPPVNPISSPTGSSGLTTPIDNDDGDKYAPFETDNDSCSCCDDGYREDEED